MIMIFMLINAKIHIPENSLIKLNDDFGIPKYMENLNPIWKEAQ